MTRYEAYLTLYYALGDKSRTFQDPSFLDFLAGMNPYTRLEEGSSDPDIYSRWCDKWIRVGSTVTSNSQNGGYTFSKVFIDTLPKRNGRYEAVKKAFYLIDQTDWHNALMLQALSGTYELLYVLLKKKSSSTSMEEQEYLKEMNPFKEGFSTTSSPIWQRFFALGENSNIDGSDYYFALSFIQSEKKDWLFTLFSKIKEKEWDEIRFERPYSFRMNGD